MGSIPLVLFANIKKEGLFLTLFVWWARRESNPHALLHKILNLARLPISPLAQNLLLDYCGLATFNRLARIRRSLAPVGISHRCARYPTSPINSCTNAKLIVCHLLTLAYAFCHASQNPLFNFQFIFRRNWFF